MGTAWGYALHSKTPDIPPPHLGLGSCSSSFMFTVLFCQLASDSHFGIDHVRFISFT